MILPEPNSSYNSMNGISTFYKFMKYKSISNIDSLDSINKIIQTTIGDKSFYVCDRYKNIICEGSDKSDSTRVDNYINDLESTIISLLN